MTFLVYLPLLLPVALALIARLLPAGARPELAARVLATCGVLTAAVSTGCLALLALTALDDLPAMEVRERTAAFPLPEPVPGAVAVGAGLLLVAAAWSVVRDLRRRRAVVADLHAAGAPHDGLLVADWTEPHAVAVPPAGAGGPGHILVTSGLLRLIDAAEWRAVAAHERAHLRRRHHRTVALATTAAAVNPLLRPVAGAVALLVERSADEDAVAAVGDRHMVARAIAKVALAGGSRTGTLGAGGSDVVRRVAALTRPVTQGSWAGLALAAAIVLGSASAGVAALADFVRVALIWIS
ncbi:M48 family metalloprotease [Dactylosporangium siamense]|uniref:Peptidase M48 n=1 Tax=Dactylosporangium siamense TaxID=685454 RepID=A0A919PS25_9ACTN|nr:M48 family metalloprotease [Dactylosporangium siamense]GIG49124.1 peptidase M48 [Dactylosporangium siamense]